jgi:hypothetical protein
LASGRIDDPLRLLIERIEARAGGSCLLIFELVRREIALAAMIITSHGIKPL